MDQKKINKRLKAILTKRTSLKNADADAAIAISEGENRPLSSVLGEKKLLTENDFISAVSLEMNLPPIDVSKVTVSDALMQMVTEEVAKYYGIFPISRIGKLLTIAVSNPFDILKLDDLKLVTGCDIRPVISTEEAIKTAIGKSYDKSAEAMNEFIDNITEPGVDIEVTTEAAEDEDIDMASLRGEGDKAHPIIQLVNMIIFQAIKEKASDIHIEPFEKKLRIRYRVDGVLSEKTSPPKKLASAISSRIKIMSNLDIAEKRRPQDGKFQLKVEGRQIDFRVSTLPIVYGEKVVMRILDSTALALNLESLGFEPQTLKHVRNAINAPYGMMLVTGPTGSGKSTTLYSCLKEIYSIDYNIVTVEDPVEYQMDGVNQTQINVKQGLTFADALRSILRQDPDIVMIGEIRDLETVEIAVKAALTGHLVLSTIHTNDAPGTITRLVDMGVDPFLVASSTILILAQRLARKLCTTCKEPIVYEKAKLIEEGYTEEDLATNPVFFKPMGCPLCVKGYKGRFAIVESMPLKEEIKRCIIDGSSSMDIKKVAMKNDMMSLRRSGLLNAMRGITSLEEVMGATITD
jgi:type IV pilus assembly protein PilB